MNRSAPAAADAAVPHLSTHEFRDSHILAEAMAERVATRLRAGIAVHDRASLAVSGGRTPVRFFDQLSRHPLDWAKVSVTLVDERWVDQHSERSNAALVKKHLLRHHAASANFVPLYVPTATPEEGLAAAIAQVGGLPPPFDAVILGMGDDGHTASFFPGGDHLAEALDLAGTQILLPMRAAGAGEPRITFSLPALLGTRELILHIEGQSKRQVLDQARRGVDQGAQYPVGAVLRQTRVPVSVFWCP